MNSVSFFLRRWWYRKVPALVRFGMSNARGAVRASDLRKLGLALAAVAFGANKRRNRPTLVYATSIDTDQSVMIRVLRGRRPIGEARVDR